jgi:hypothetical protein
VKLIGGPLDGQTFKIGQNSTRLALHHPEFGDDSPPVGDYRRENGWRFQSFEGRA